MMLRWLRHRRARIERIEAGAEALIRGLGDRAYSEARRRGHEASSDAMARDWNRIALTIAHKTGRHIGLDPSTRMAMNAVVVPHREPATTCEPRPSSELGPADVPKRVLSPRSLLFRIQFVGAAPDRGTTILEEVQIQAADVSAAIVAVASAVWPPETIELRILDREDREVFGRQKADRR